MVLSSYQPGTLCWAKLKGYPWWPSRIENESKLSDEVLESKPRNGRAYPVLFFGSLDYAWMTPDNLEPYEQNLAKFGSKAKNRKDPSFADALKQAQDPSVADEIIKRTAAGAAASDAGSDGDEDEDEEMQSVDSEPEQPTKAKAKAKAPTKKAQGGGRSRKPAVSKKRTNNSNSSASEDDDNDMATATPKRSRTSVGNKRSSNGGSPAGNGNGGGDGSYDSQRSRSPSVQRTSEHSDRHSSHSASKDDGKHGRSSKHTKGGSKTFQFLMQLRHRLQKTIIKGPVPDDLAPVNDVFKKLEDFDMTLELIQETKLGKVMRIIASSDKLGDAPEEKFDFKDRARRLAEKWRRLIVKRREGSAEPSAPESAQDRPGAEAQADANTAEDVTTSEPAASPHVNQDAAGVASASSKPEVASVESSGRPEAAPVPAGANGTAHDNS